MTVFAAVTGILGTVGAAIFSLFLEYVWLAVSLAFAAHGFYGIVFYYIGYLNAASCERALPAIESGTLDYESLAPIMNRRPPAIRKLLNGCVARGVLVGYFVGETCLTPIAPQIKEKAENENLTDTEEI